MVLLLKKGKKENPSHDKPISLTLIPEKEVDANNPGNHSQNHEGQSV